jgi:hypothetical protein
METIKFNEYLDRMGGESKIEKIYTGKESGCRCGCGGRYFEPGEHGFKLALTKIRKANPEAIVFKLSKEGEDDERAMQEWYGKHPTRDMEPGTCYGTIYLDRSSWIDWCCGWDRTVTVYFKEN